MDKIRKFSKKADMDTINEWAFKRAKESFLITDLPEYGLIHPEVAAGFLYKTDSFVALLENFISNPNVSLERRSSVLKKIAEQLMQKAKDLGFTKIYAITDKSQIKKYCNELEFKHIGQYEIFGKEI